MSGSGNSRLSVQKKTGLPNLQQSGFGVKLGIEKIFEWFNGSERMET